MFENYPSTLSKSLASSTSSSNDKGNQSMTPSNTNEQQSVSENKQKLSMSELEEQLLLRLQTIRKLQIQLKISNRQSKFNKRYRSD